MGKKMRSPPKEMLYWHFHQSRLIIAFAVFVLGYSIVLQSRDVYEPLLQACKRMLGGSETTTTTAKFARSQYYNETLKYEDLFVQAAQCVGITMIAGAVFIVLNCRVIGCHLCLLALACVMATQDNPFIV